MTMKAAEKKSSMSEKAADAPGGGNSKLELDGRWTWKLSALPVRVRLTIRANCSGAFIYQVEISVNKFTNPLAVWPHSCNLEMFCVGSVAMMRARCRLHLRAHVRLRWQLRRWRRDQSGVTAIEFGIVAMPFMMLLFGIISVCLYFFTKFTMENAVWQAARAIRTGQFQQGQGAYSGSARRSQESIQEGPVRQGTQLSSTATKRSSSCRATAAASAASRSPTAPPTA